MDERNLFEKVREVYENLPKQQKVIADAILNNYEEIVLLNAKELSEKTNVSSATIIRFAQFLGYDGYPDLARELRKTFFEDNSPMMKLKESFDGPSDPADTFKQVLQLDQENIRLLEKQNMGNDIKDALELLLNSKKVVIFGGRTSYALVHYAGFLFRELDQKFEYFNSSCDDSLERLRVLQKSDCCLAISFHRYFKRTIDLASYCNRRDVPVIGLTDSTKSPLLLYSSLVLFAPNKAPFYSYVPSMAIINVLIVCYARLVNKSNKDVLERHMKELLDNDIYV
jgi:DNA-binding MurR/RpiR family transcriptional regulator